MTDTSNPTSRLHQTAREPSPQEAATLEELRSSLNHAETLIGRLRDMQYPLSAIIANDSADLGYLSNTISADPPTGTSLVFGATFGTDPFGKALERLEEAWLWSQQGVTYG